MIAGHYAERNEEDVTLYGTTGTKIRWLINRDNGARTFAMRRYVIQPGGEIPLHHHDADHEMYCLSGQGVAYTKAQEIVLHKDMFVYVPPNEEHGYRNTGNEPLIFLCIIPLTD